jgi:hypothetical protein
VLLVPEPELGAVDLDDGTLDEGLGPHELIVGGVVDDVKDTGLASGGLAGPGEVASFQAESALLDVATAATDVTDALGA